MQLNVVDVVTHVSLLLDLSFALLARGVASTTNVASWNDAADDLLDDALDSDSSASMHVNMQEASAMNPHLEMLEEGGGALSESLGLPLPLGPYRQQRPHPRRARPVWPAANDDDDTNATHLLSEPEPRTSSVRPKTAICSQ